MQTTTQPNGMFDACFMNKKLRTLRLRFKFYTKASEFSHSKKLL